MIMLISVIRIKIVPFSEEQPGILLTWKWLRVFLLCAGKFGAKSHWHFKFRIKGPYITEFRLSKVLKAAKVND